MKKILIVAPFADFGGREVHVNLIAKCLAPYYNVNILSTYFATSDSFAFRDIDKSKCFVLNKELIRNNILLRALTLLSYLKNDKRYDFHFYLHNSFTKKHINLNKLKVNYLEKFIKNYDLLIMPVILNEPFVKVILNAGNLNKTSIIIVTVATIKKNMIEENDYLKKATHFIHHSKANAENLEKYLKHSYSIIDQSVPNETALLNISVQTSSKLTYGYIGRMEKGKNVPKLLNYFKLKNNTFLLAGAGSELNEIRKETEKTKNCKYLGVFNPSTLADFYKQIDVLIISSDEEAGPFTGIEAMAAGKIIISTRVGAMEERLSSTKNNFWIDIDDFDKSLSSSISLLESLNDIELKEIGNINRKKYLNHYSFNMIQKKYKNLIDEIL